MNTGLGIPESRSFTCRRKSTLSGNGLPKLISVYMIWWVSATCDSVNNVISLCRFGKESLAYGKGRARPGPAFCLP